MGYGLAAWYGFRQLDGMSGDISGFALTVGELVGAATLLYVGETMDLVIGGAFQGKLCGGAGI